MPNNDGIYENFRDINEVNRAIHLLEKFARAALETDDQKSAAIATVASGALRWARGDLDEVFEGVLNSIERNWDGGKS